MTRAEAIDLALELEALGRPDGTPPRSGRRYAPDLCDAEGAATDAEQLLLSAAAIRPGAARNAVLGMARRWASLAEGIAEPIASSDGPDRHGRRASALRVVARAAAVQRRATPDGDGSVLLYVEEPVSGVVQRGGKAA